MQCMITQRTAPVAVKSTGCASISSSPSVAPSLEELFWAQSLSQGASMSPSTSGENKFGSSLSTSPPWSGPDPSFFWLRKNHHLRSSFGRSSFSSDCSEVSDFSCTDEIFLTDFDISDSNNNGNSNNNEENFDNNNNNATADISQNEMSTETAVPTVQVPKAASHEKEDQNNNVSGNKNIIKNINANANLNANKNININKNINNIKNNNLTVVKDEESKKKSKKKNDNPSRTRLLDDDGFIRRAACICLDETESKILLISSKSDHCSWLIPGGGIEAGEDMATAALREAWEEAGVRGQISRYLGLFETIHPSGKKKHRTGVFVVSTQSVEADFPEAYLGRSRKWFTLEEALLHLSNTRPLQSAYLQLLLVSRLKASDEA